MDGCEIVGLILKTTSFVHVSNQKAWGHWSVFPMHSFLSKLIVFSSLQWLESFCNVLHLNHYISSYCTLLQQVVLDDLHNEIAVCQTKCQCLLYSFFVVPDSNKLSFMALQPT